MLRFRDARFRTIRQALRQPGWILQTSFVSRRRFTTTTNVLTAGSEKKGRSRTKLRSGREPLKAGSRGKARRKTQSSRGAPGDQPVIAPDPLSPFFGYSIDFSEDASTREPTKGGAWMSLTDRLTESEGDSSDQAAADSSLKSSTKKKHGSSSSEPGSSIRKKNSQSENKIHSTGKKGTINGRKAGSKGTKNSSRETIHPAKITNEPVETDEELEVPRLQHNLDRVLFNPGVHVMRDARSRVYNFDPDIAEIMPASEFDYDALGEYITSSKDEKLRELCAKYNKKYCGSTSSLSSILAHFHYLVSAWRKPNFQQLSGSIRPDSTNFTQILRSPAAAFAHYRNGSYAIDADKEYDMDNILSSLGKSMEKHLLLPKEEFDKYRRTRSHEISEEQRNAGESYHYSKLGDFLIRSQLDAYDPRLPGTGVFDIKTRAVISIRMDVMGYEKGTGYEINRLRGQWHSFEREYLDMIRAAFLKYSLQVRMGRMDGIFCAYHNTQRIFGFQYIPLSEMDVALHGTENTRLGDDEFKASVTMLNALLNRGAERWPGRTLRLHVETRDTVIPLMYFFIQPVTEEAMAAIQMANKSSAEASTAKVVAKLKNLQASLDEQGPEETAVEPPPEDETADNSDEASGSGTEADEVWDELMSKIGDVIENDTNGLESVRAAVVSALERQRLLEGKSDAEAVRYIDTLMDSLVGSLPDENTTSQNDQTGENEIEDAEAEEPEKSAVKESLSDDGPASSDFASHENEVLSSSRPTDPLDPSENGLIKEKEPLYTTETLHTVESQAFAGPPDTSDVQIPGSAKEPEFAEGLVNETTSEVSEQPEASDVSGTAGDPEFNQADASTEDSALATETSGLSLNELVLRAAANADSKSGELRTFERVFAELLAESKTKDSEKRLHVTSEERVSSDNKETVEAVGDPSSTDTPPSQPSLKRNLEDGELLGMVVTVKNHVDGKYEDRPEGNYRKWAIEYSVTELDDEKARAVYAQIKKRRASNLTFDRTRRDADWYTMFRGDLQKATQRSKELRKKLEKEDRERKTIHVAWDEAPRPFKQA